MSFFAPAAFTSKRLSAVLLAMAAICVAGCHWQSPSNKPTLTITRVPPADPGGPDQLDYIEGRADGAAPGQQIVLYAHSGAWWVQPFGLQPMTKIQADSTWKNSTHLGTEYGALLVEAGYRPASKLVSLPTGGHGVVAVALAKGAPVRPLVAKVIHFSGYDWKVQAAGSDRGGEANAYDPENAWVDEKGYLHLKMAQRAGRWTCAEVALTRSLGFGTYTFVVEDSAHLAPSAVMGMFTWNEAGSDESRSELDIELSRWGNAGGKNAQYVVQPYYVAENVARFSAPPGLLTHVLRWQPGVASFNTVHGAGARADSRTVSQHVFTSGVPNPTGEVVHIDLYDFYHSKSVLEAPVEVVVEKFEYLP
jgi:hypothetical protein